MGHSAPVGVFDSGVGGISVLAELQRTLPGEQFLYYGDQAYAPYGTRSPEEVLTRAEEVTSLLLSRGAKALVIACNTATSVAAATLRARLTLPIVGMEPALKPAALMRHGGRILVLATPVTLRLPKFQALMARYGEGAEPVPCPGLMELVEEERFAEGAAMAAERVLASDRPVDAVVLGCTHYVFLRPELERLLPQGVAILDGNRGTANQLRRVLAAGNLLAEGQAGGLELLTSGEQETVLPLMRRLLVRARDIASGP